MSKHSASFDITGEIPAMRRYAAVLTRDPEEAEDLVHEALLRACEKRHSFRPDAKLRPWLLSILHNCFVDRTRRRTTERKLLASASDLSSPFQEPPQDHQLRLSQIKQRFMALPEEQRSAIHLVAIEDLSYQDAALALGIPLGTLMSRLGRARAALRNFENAGITPTEKAESRGEPRLRLVGGTDDASA